MFNAKEKLTFTLRVQVSVNPNQSGDGEAYSFGNLSVGGDSTIHPVSWEQAIEILRRFNELATKVIKEFQV